MTAGGRLMTVQCTHKALDAAEDSHHTSSGTETRQLTDDLSCQTLNLPVSVLQQVDQTHDTAELLQRHTDSLACTHLAQNLQRTHLYVDRNPMFTSRLIAETVSRRPFL